MMRNYLKKNGNAFLGIMAALLFVGTVLCRAGIAFETNDDRYIAEIFAGVLTVEPDTHVVFINYLLALPISWLYHVFPGIPWYGGCLIGFHFLVYAVIIKQVCDLGKNLAEKVVGIMMMLVFFSAHLYILGQIQFTSTAALLAIAGYICLLLKGDKGKFCFFLFELLGFFLRSDAMLMIQPIGLGAVVLVLLIQKEYVWKEKFRFLLQMAVLLVAIFLLGLVGDLAGYRSSEWKDYERFTEARSEMFDIYGVMPYEDVKTILDKYQVTETEYEAYLNYTILDWDISIECSEELVAYIKVNAQRNQTVLNVIEMVWEQLTVSDYFRLNRLMLEMWILFGIWVIVRKKWSLLLPAAGIAGSSGIVWFYLLWQGRIPKRVTIPALMCETIFLLMLLMWDYARCNKTRVLRGLMLGICAIFCVTGMKTAQVQYRYVKEQNNNREIFTQGMYELQDYCRERSENRYLVEAESISYYTGSALDTRMYEQRNSVASGCWYANSPSMREKLKTYFQDSEDRLRLIILQDGDEMNHPALKLLEEKTKLEAVLEESFGVSHGGIYAVYKFEEVK